jgi:hypothetical protein
MLMDHMFITIYTYNMIRYKVYIIKSPYLFILQSKLKLYSHNNSKMNSSILPLSLFACNRVIIIYFLVISETLDIFYKSLFTEDN